MAAPSIRKLVTASQGAGALGSISLREDDGPLLPWDAIKARLAELLRFLASALPALAAGIREWTAAMVRQASAALPAAAVMALVVVLCCCCCGYCAAGGRRRRRGPDGEEADGFCDGLVVRCGGRGGGGGGYKGGIFSMHPNKPIVC